MGLRANRDLVARALAQGITSFLGARPEGGWPAPPILPPGDVVAVLPDRALLHAGPGADWKVVDSAVGTERFLVVERRSGWAKLFFWGAKECWIAETEIK